MEERTPRNRISHAGLATKELDRVRSWVEAYAAHVRKRFDSRAIVSVRLGGAPPVELSHVYALESGGLVLVTCCDHPEHGSAHEHVHAVPEHHRIAAAHHGEAGPHDDGAHGEAHGHEHGPAEHGHGAPPHASPAHEDDGHHHGEGEACPGRELWLSSPDRAVFEAHCAEEGVLCTGFGYLGLSRTPHMLIQRGTEAPPKAGHEHGNF